MTWEVKVHLTASGGGTEREKDGRRKRGRGGKRFKDIPSVMHVLQPGPNNSFSYEVISKLTC